MNAEYWLNPGVHISELDHCWGIVGNPLNRVWISSRARAPGSGFSYVLSEEKVFRPACPIRSYPGVDA
jgi:hypothetical protein